MPACARSKIVIEGEVGIYHCIARCVRQAFLCGIDEYTGKDFSHRKGIILARMRELAGLFAIDVCGYSVMSNHLHLVLRTRPDLADQWSAEDIARRWCGIFPSHDDAGKPVEPGEHDLAMITGNSERLAELRKRLPSLSWFMRCLCEKVAREANKEDKGSGRFWAGRFKSVALLDEAAVLACSVYVDLNPIRAKLVDTPEESLYTSGRDRIRSMHGTSAEVPSQGQLSLPQSLPRPDAWLCELTIQEQAHDCYFNDQLAAGAMSHTLASDAVPTALPTAAVAAEAMTGAEHLDARPDVVATAATVPLRLGVRASDQGFLPISTEQYIMLLDWTGRELRADKRGAIPEHLAPIMERLALNRSNWVETVSRFGELFKQAAGRYSSLVGAAAKRSRHWFQGKAAAQAAFV